MVRAFVEAPPDKFPDYGHRLAQPVGAAIESGNDETLHYMLSLATEIVNQSDCSREAPVHQAI